MTSRQLISVLLILVATGILFTAGKLLITKPAEEVVPIPTETAVACTMEAKQCPDGSYVGRSGPKCEFAQCPAIAATSTVTVRMNEKIVRGDWIVFPGDIVEESRCPLDVQCIQAGTVRVRLSISIKNVITTDVVTLGKPLQVGTHTVTLTDVTPLKKAGETILPSSYRFTFEIK